MASNQERKKPATWDVQETECFLAIIKELQVIALMDGKKFRTSEIFKKVEEVFKSKGYQKTPTQLLDKFKTMKKRFKATTEALSVSGTGTKDKVKCPFFEELSEIFGHRPIVNQSGVDSTVLPPDLNDETSGYCASNAGSVVTSEDSEGRDGSQKRQFMERTSGRSSLSPFTSTSHRTSSSDVLKSPLSPTFSCLSEDSNASSMPSLDSCELDGSDKLCASSKKRKICKTPTYPRREGPRSNLKIMQNFTQQIIESQENLLTKTIEEQRKLDQEMLNQYNHIFLQQTQMLLTGLQNLNSPLPTNYPTVQQFPRIPTMPPMNPMFTETLLPQNNKNTAHPYTSPWHEMQTCPKPDQIELCSLFLVCLLLVLVLS
ncbi:uncharacterized protein LOC143908462 [Temnothorax americanus]|uniref:uncharacterized protein LOC143908462 n=1 Tax=Temnothorax americanus TaxID=1964332 RepID=UPI004067F295